MDFLLQQLLTGLASASGLFLVASGVLTIAIQRAGAILPDHHPTVALFFLLYALFTISTGYDQPKGGYVSFDRVSQIASILILGPLDAAWVNGLASLIFPWQRLRTGTPGHQAPTPPEHP